MCRSNHDHLHCRLVARAACMAISLSWTLALDSAALRHEAAAIAAAAPPLEAATPFQPARRRAPAGAEGSAAPGSSGQPSGQGSGGSSDLDSPDLKRETEAASRPYIAAVSPLRDAPLPPIAEGPEGAAARTLAAPPLAWAAQGGDGSGGGAAASSSEPAAAAAAAALKRLTGISHRAIAESAEATPPPWQYPHDQVPVSCSAAVA